MEQRELGTLAILRKYGLMNAYIGLEAINPDIVRYVGDSMNSRR
jgi:hypothetical protein